MNSKLKLLVKDLAEILADKQIMPATHEMELNYIKEYGGYVIVYVDKENGTEHTPFRPDRLSSKDMLNYLHGLIDGILI